MKTYEIRTGTNPDVYAPIAKVDIVYGDFIRTTYPNGTQGSERWQQGKPVDPPPTDAITISSVAPSTVADGRYIATESVALTISGTVDGLPDGSYIFPVKRIDTGRIIYMTASLVSGALTVSGSFPTSGDWRVDNALIKDKAISHKDYLPFEINFTILGA